MGVRYGIKTLEDLRERCVVDDFTGCWTFQVQHRPARRGDWGCNVWLSDQQRSETLQRAGWLLAGRPMGKGRGWVVWRTCTNLLCCNPAHLRAGPREQMGQWQEQKGTLRGDPKRAAINRRIKIESGQSKLTHELADWIRESAQTGLAIAHALDVSRTCVSRVRMGQTYVRTMPASSVFSWGLTARR